jgi:hypothetical protein
MRTPPPSCITACLALLLAAPAQAQTLEDRVSQLFMVGSRTVPLQVSAPGDALRASGRLGENDDFLPSAVQANAAVLDFLTRWMGVSPGYLPLGTTSGGVAFRFEGAVPVPTASSAGPLFAERAPTLGRGRGVVGANYTRTRFNTARGRPLEDLRLNFTSVNLDSDLCDAQQGRDCAPLGVPLSENDVLSLLLSLNLDVEVGSLFATYGLLDRLDVGVILPVVHTRIAGHSIAEVIPFGTSPTGATHFISGTPQDPVLSSAQSTQGSAFGIGDIAARVKLNVMDRERGALAVLADVRFPTGDEKDFLGTGELSARGLGIVSMQFGSFSPHLNLGYVWRGGEASNGAANDALLATVGFDQLFASWATFAADLVSEFQVGKSVFEVPPPVTFTVPFVRSVRPMELSDARDNIVSAAIGFKLGTLSNFTGVVNALIPITGSSPRPDFAWSLGVEYDF